MRAKFLSLSGDTFAIKNAKTKAVLFNVKGELTSLKTKQAQLTS